MSSNTLKDYGDRIQAANAMSRSIQYMTMRNYLDVLSPQKKCDIFISPENQNNDFSFPVQWIKIEQIGKDVSSSPHYYFSTIQKILLSCHDPQKKQLLFLIQGDGIKINLFIGIRLYSDVEDTSFANYLATYIKSIWPGTSTSLVSADCDGPSDALFGDSSKKVFSITGIPSFLKKDGEEGLTSIDALIGTLSNRKFSYLVIANPIPEIQVSSIIEQCNEMAGQLESVKTFSFTESKNTSRSHSHTITRGQNITHTTGQSESTRNKAAQGLLAGASLAAGMCFGPLAGKLPEMMASMLTHLTESPHFGLGVMTASNIMSGFISQESKNSGKSVTDIDQTSDQEGFTEGQAESLSTTIVNRHVDYALKRLDSQISRFEDGLGSGMWRTAVYLVSDEDVIGESAAMQFRSIVSGKNSHLEPIRIHNLSYLRNKDVFSITLNRYSFPNLPIKFKYSNSESPCFIENPFEGDYSQLSTFLTTEELSCLVNFPQRSIPGISVIESSPDFPLAPRGDSQDTPGIQIGKLLYAGAETDIKIKVPFPVLSRHTLVTGVNGSGKTNTVIKVLEGLIQNNTPFLVLEPAKTEYVDWAINYNVQLRRDKLNGKRLEEEEIIIFAPGKSFLHQKNCKEYSEKYFLKDELRFNPFEVITLNEKPEATDVLAHIDRLKSTFASAFPVYDILPVVMETVLYHLYTTGEKWLSDEENPKKRFPTLSLMSACIPGVVESLGYDKKTNDNISAAMLTRINSLLRGWKGRMLNNERLSNLSWTKVFSSKCILNLSAFGDDVDRSFIMSLILQFLYEYRIAESWRPDFKFSDNNTRHLVVVEEAHRVMSNNTDYNSPQFKSGIMFSNMLSEIRAYGQGLMIVDQVPSRLIPDAIKNTNMKIIHRLISADDINAVADSMGLSQNQRLIIPKLSTGQVILSGIYSGKTTFTSDSDVFWSKVLFS